MKRVTWPDKDGFMHVSLVRDLDEDSKAPKGIPVGPPSLEGIDWEEVKRDLNNRLVQQELLTWADVQRAQTGITSCVLAVLRHRLIALYRNHPVSES